MCISGRLRVRLRSPPGAIWPEILSLALMAVASARLVVAVLLAWPPAVLSGRLAVRHETEPAGDPAKDGAAPAQDAAGEPWSGPRNLEVLDELFAGGQAGGVLGGSAVSMCACVRA